MKECSHKLILVVAACAMVLALAGASSAFPAREVYSKASGSVVFILSSDGRGGNSIGAGSIINSDGLVITNAHVVVDKQSNKPYGKIRVYTRPDQITGSTKNDLRQMYGASVAAYDEDLDLAVLRTDGLKPKDGVIALADPDDIGIGEEVVAIGHPEQGGLWTLTYGRISGFIADQSGVKGKDVYQTDTSLNRGNSGGPLLDARGYMVGVNTNIARRGEGNLAITGVNFALKSSVVKLWLSTKGLDIAYGAEPLPSETPTEARPAGESAASATAPASPLAEKKPAEASAPATSRVDEAGPATADTKPKSGDILTEKRPFSYEDVFKDAESEMEDMMQEMRGKVKGRGAW